MPFPISPLLVTAYRELAALERFAFRRAQLLEGLDWSAMTIEFRCQASCNDEELAKNLFSLSAYVDHLECRMRCAPVRSICC
ncbi:hypothetical protein H5V43_21880 (plasmid) [Sphingobium fuliginis]|jgi:hypothetical protein|uniref:Uncharacterized protein n=1 Tax=Sphingobium fuliginis (strain ATCC 27551) TaxID=336203 RepID=A0A7M2GP54_SPHSA|nr:MULTISPECIES: hypothetical protein [Sphingobium]QOT74524.1 hypothetical protein H5V43_21880 [Sphingobium fuliginis]